MVFSLDSSLVLAAIVGLWLVWVAPSVLRGTLPAAPGSIRRSPKLRLDPYQESTMMMTTDSDTAQASATDVPPPTGSGREATAHMAGTRRPPTLHVGRLAVASAAALGVVAALVTLVLALVSVVSFLVPLGCVAVVMAAVVVLRILAVRSRRARVQRAFAHAMAPVRRTEPRSSTAPVVPQRPTHLFDADASAPRALTPMEQRTASLAADRGSFAADATAGPVTATVLADPLPAGATAWVPVELPRPTYVDAAKAEREAPAPLDLPEAPRPTTRTPIKTAEAAVRALSANEEQVAPTGTTGPATGRINLDDVLQRRRA